MGTVDKHAQKRIAIVLPASNEEALIGPCLRAVLASDWPFSEGLETIVVANGCHDNTVAVARSLADEFSARGWALTVVDRAEGGKLAALNAGDAEVTAPVRIYLDADVTVSPPLLAQLAEALDTPTPRYASGALNITAQGTTSRAYARIWRQVPFMRVGVPGCGLFAVNAAGRARWAAFPDIISDDIFVRLSFSPKERFAVKAAYDWPIAEGFATLVKVRKRQDAGVSEISACYPHMMVNEDKPPFPMSLLFSLARRDPFGFAVYFGVSLAVKLSPRRAQGWSRGR